MAQQNDTELGASVDALTANLNSEDEDDEAEADEAQAEWGAAPENDRTQMDEGENMVAVEVLLASGHVYEAWASAGGEDGMCTYATLYLPGVRFTDTHAEGAGAISEGATYVEVAEFKDSGEYSVQGRGPHLRQDRFRMLASGLNSSTQVEAVRPAQEGGA